MTYQWQVSQDGGTTFTNISDSATNASYTNLVTQLTDNGNQYQVIVVEGTTSLTSAPPAVLTVKLPAVSVNSATICARGSASLTATTDASSPSYQWNDPSNATTASITVSPGSTTTYTVTVTDGETGCVNSGSGTVTVNALPTVGVNSATICAGGSAVLTATTGASSPSYLWNDPSSATTASLTVSPGVDDELHGDGDRRHDGLRQQRQRHGDGQSAAGGEREFGDD